MTGSEHYEAAEKLLDALQQVGLDPDTTARLGERLQGHAALAQAAAALQIAAADERIAADEDRIAGCVDSSDTRLLVGTRQA